MPNAPMQSVPPHRGSPSLVPYLWALVAMVAALATTNPLLTAACVLVLALLGRLLWRPGEPPVLLFAAGYQWIQVSTLVFVADYNSKPVSMLSFSPQVEKAIWLGLLGLVMLGAGMHIGVRRLGNARSAILDPALRVFSVERVFALYAIFAVIAAVTPYLVWKLLPIAQIIYQIADLKWVFYLLLGYLTFGRQAKRGYFIAATLAEFIAGIGFFSEFKTVFFMCGLLILSLHLRINLRMILAVAGVSTVIFFAGLAWMSIRDDYRSFLNQGTGQQVVLVSPVEQVKEFGSLVSEVDAGDLRSSAEEMFTRLAYVDYFAAVLNYVPKQRPFEGGHLLWSAIRHMLIPRFLDPNKEVLESDSEITMRYTGLTVASSREGTSIGIGYMAEGYVDFGVYGMLILVMAFGLIWGRMYTWVVSQTRVVATGLAFGTALIMGASQFEVAEVKLLAGMVAKFLVFAVVLRYVMPTVHRWLAVDARTAKLGVVPGANALNDTPVVSIGSN